MVDGLIELNDRTYGWRAESDLQIRKFRGSGFLRGRHAYKITDAGFVVHPGSRRFWRIPRGRIRAASQRTSSGVTGLDRHAERGTARRLDHHDHGPLRGGQDHCRVFIFWRGPPRLSQA